MPLYAVTVTATHIDTVTVEAESAEDALRIVRSPAFSYDQAESVDHDISPDLEPIEAIQA